jgi:hypothetical protein
MTDADQHDPSSGPEFEVWNHLWSGIELAIQELDVLESNSRETVERLGKLLAETRTGLTLAAGTDAAAFSQISDMLTDVPWVRHAAEIELATEGIGRTERSLKRYLKLRPIVIRTPIPARAQPYVRELVDTFAFGFDAACIALSRAAMEQVLKDRLLVVGEYTEARLRREKPGPQELIVAAKRRAVLENSFEAAGRVADRGNTVLHSFIYDEKVLQQEALDSISDLLKVLTECIP